mgnify:FL=1
MNKRILGVFIAAILVLSISVGASFAANSGGASADHRQDGAQKQLKEGNPHQFKQLKLMYTTTDPESADPIVWKHVPGNEGSGFRLCLNEADEYYYLDVMALQAYMPIVNGEYRFCLEPEAIEDQQGWLEYWTGRGVNVTSSDANADYMLTLYDIFIEGSLPVFYLDVEGSNYMLLDGFQYFYGEEQKLRVDGDYFLGTFTYKGEVVFEDVDPIEMTMQITFRACECETCVED